MTYVTKYQISFSIATLLAFIMLSSNLEQLSKVYGTPKETKTSTGILETKKDGIKDLPKTIGTIPKIKTPVVVPVKGSVKTAKSSTIPTSEQKIYRNGWNDPRVQYAYNISGGNMDFIKTIEAESKWDVNALGDNGKSFGLCQIHKGFNAKMQKQYRALKTDNEKVKMCYDQYQNWVKRGVIKTRLYGYNVRNKEQNKKPFTFK